MRAIVASILALAGGSRRRGGAADVPSTNKIVRKADQKTVDGPAEYFTGKGDHHRPVPTAGPFAGWRGDRPA